MALSATRRQSVLPLLVSLAFVAIGVLLIREGDRSLMTSAAVVFFGVGAVLFAYLAITGRASLVLVQPKESRVELEPGGFAVLTARGRRFPVRWASVRRVIAYKRDLRSTDEICVLFESADDSRQEVSEEWPGFKELFGVMEKELGVSPGWYMEIMMPPFELTPRLLFDRTEHTRPRVEAGGG
jgi:hypothetical protein